jgi:hypothetical protein
LLSISFDSTHFTSLKIVIQKYLRFSVKKERKEEKLRKSEKYLSRQDFFHAQPPSLSSPVAMFISCTLLFFLPGARSLLSGLHAHHTQLPPPAVSAARPSLELRSASSTGTRSSSLVPRPYFSFFPATR